MSAKNDSVEKFKKFNFKELPTKVKCHFVTAEDISLRYKTCRSAAREWGRA